MYFFREPASPLDDDKTVYIADMGFDCGGPFHRIDNYKSSGAMTVWSSFDQTYLTSLMNCPVTLQSISAFIEDMEHPVDSCWQQM